VNAGAVRDLPDLIGAIDAMTRAVAAADPAARQCLESCPQCRNHLLYVLDTEQYTGDGSLFARRLAAAPDNHRRSHGPLSPADRNRPEIRGVSS